MGFGKCRIVKQIGQGTQEEKGRKEVSSVSCWSGGYEQRAVCESQPERRKSGVESIKTFLVLPVAAIYFAVMSGSVRTNQLMLDTQLGGGFLKKGLEIPVTVRKRLVNSKPLSVWTHSTRIPLRAYHFTNRFRKSAEE